MRKLSQKLLRGTAVFSVASVLAPVLAYAQSYYDYYDYTAGDAAAGATFLGGLTIVYICACCIGLIVPIACAVIVYKDSQKNNVENGVLWAILSFLFPLIGILIYFLVIKPDAAKKGGVGSAVKEMKEKVEEKVEEVKEDMKE